MKRKWIHLTLVVLIALVSILVFYKTSRFDFITDDWRLIYDEKEYLDDWSNLKVVLTEPFPAETYEPLPFYRPVITLVNFVNHHLLGSSTFGYHIVNLGFHALNSILVYLLIFLLFKKELLALLSALFFSAHPIHTNSVVWISGRTDLIACFFILLTLILFFKRKDHAGTWRTILSLGALLSFLLALFSKEMALALPLFLFLWDYLYDKDSIKKKIVPYIPYLAVTVLYLILRIAAIGNLGAGESYTSANLFQRFLTAFAIYFYYFKKFIIPAYLNFSPRVLTITTIFSLKFWGALIFFSLMVGLGLSLRRITKEVSFGIFWILVMLIPVLNLVPLHSSVRDWWAYIPSIGFCLILGKIAAGLVVWNSRLLEIKLPKRKPKEEEIAGPEAPPPETVEPAPAEEEIPKKTRIRLPERLILRAGHVMALLFAFLILVYAFTAQSRARIFRKDYHLWTNTTKTAPYDAQAHLSLGQILMRKNVTRWAKMSFQKAVLADSTLAEAHHSFSTTLSMSGQNDSAMVFARKAVELDPDYVEAWNNLGIIYGDMMEHDSAIVAFEHVLELDSTHFSAANNLGIIYSDMEEFPQALRYFEIALKIAPGEGQADAVREQINQIRVRGYR